MSRSHEGFAQLMERAAQGSEEAFWNLLESYSTNILRALRKHLPVAIQSKVDARDVLQSAWRSILRTGVQVEIMSSPDRFAAYLMGVARNKARETRRRFMDLPGYDVRREARTDKLLPSTFSNAQANPLDRLLVPGKANDRPSEVAAAREKWQIAMNETGEQGRRIVELRLQGLTLDEIAAEVHLSKSTVRRTLDALLQSLTA
jgi:RNA polymerase sigma factor (sigma-70 family)